MFLFLFDYTLYLLYCLKWKNKKHAPIMSIKKTFGLTVTAALLQGGTAPGSNFSLEE